jgi:hypothetical protein
MGADLSTAQKPNGKINEFRKTISEYSKLPSNVLPMVLGENLGDEQELEIVPAEGYRLPNGEIYPKNLCSTLKKLIHSQRPMLDMTQFHLCSTHGAEFTSKTVANLSLLDISHPKVTRAFSLLTNVNMNSNDTEISRALEAALEQENNQSALLNSLGYLKTALNEQRIFTFSDIPVTTPDTAALFVSLKKDVGVSLLLKNAFGLKPPTLNTYPVGYGYSLENDLPLSTTPLQMKTSGQASCLGFALPIGVHCKLTPLRIKLTEERFSTQEDYLDLRHDILNIPRRKHTNKTYAISQKKGYTQINSSLRSVYIEFRIFEVEVDQVVLSNEFLEQGAKLHTFNSSDPSSILAFEKFSKHYGTYIIQKLLGGGFIQMEFPNSDPYKAAPLESIEDVAELAKSKSEPGISVSMHGGDPKFHTENIEGLFQEIHGPSLFTRWKHSLQHYPILLHHTPDVLTRLPDIMRAAGRSQQIVQETSKAVAYLEDEEVDLLGNLNSCKEKLVDESTVKISLQMQIRNITLDRISLQREIMTSRSSASEKELQILGLKENVGNLQRKIISLESSLEGAKAQVRDEQANLKLSQEQLKKEQEESLKLQKSVSDAVSACANIRAPVPPPPSYPRFQHVSARWFGRNRHWSG